MRHKAICLLAGHLGNGTASRDSGLGPEPGDSWPWPASLLSAAGFPGPGGGFPGFPFGFPAQGFAGGLAGGKLQNGAAGAQLPGFLDSSGNIDFTKLAAMVSWNSIVMFVCHLYCHVAKSSTHVKDDDD